MADQNQSPAYSSSSAAVGSRSRCVRRRNWVEDDMDAGDPVACTGKSCQSCTAGVIADCVAVCCCPCAVVNILALAFVKLPLAVARRCLSRRKRRSRRRMVEEKRQCGGGGGRDVISGAIASEIVCVIGEEEGNDDFSLEFKGDEVWLELYEFGHLGFGRVSFTGLPFHGKGSLGN